MREEMEMEMEIRDLVEVRLQNFAVPVRIVCTSGDSVLIADDMEQIISVTMEYKNGLVLILKPKVPPTTYRSDTGPTINIGGGVTGGNVNIGGIQSFTGPTSFSMGEISQPTGLQISVPTSVNLKIQNCTDVTVSHD